MIDDCLLITGSGDRPKSAAGRQLEQQLEQPPRRQPEQQQPDEHEQQCGVPVRVLPKNIPQRPGALWWSPTVI